MEKLTLIKNEKLNCRECGQPISGRCDKRFCDDSCRNAFNNKLRRSIGRNLNSINACLKKNRNILEKLYADNQLSVPKASLERMGFNFAFFTHQVNPDNKSTVTMIYDYGFYPETKNFAEEQIAILRGDEVGP
jgi:predicted nucleic acid-binding Zn ribbon protein